MSEIPFCRSEFLQDFSIELGRRVQRGEFPSTVTVETDTCEQEGEELERLCVWVQTYYMTRVIMTLLENRMARIWVELLPTENDSGYWVSFSPDCGKFTTAELVEALRDSWGVSTRLCYAESPLPLLRKIWAYEGDVETDGFLRG